MKRKIYAIFAMYMAVILLVSTPMNAYASSSSTDRDWKTVVMDYLRLGITLTPGEA